MTRGEIWLVSFDPAIGDEIQKMRPAAIVSGDVYGVLRLRLVVPITGWQEAFAARPWMIEIAPTPGNGLSKQSAADAFQVKSLSTRRFVRRIGRAADEQLGAIAEAIAHLVGFAPEAAGEQEE